MKNRDIAGVSFVAKTWFCDSYNGIRNSEVHYLQF